MSKLETAIKNYKKLTAECDILKTLLEESCSEDFCIHTKTVDMHFEGADVKFKNDIIKVITAEYEKRAAEQNILSEKLSALELLS